MGGEVIVRGSRHRFGCLQDAELSCERKDALPEDLDGWNDAISERGDRRSEKWVQTSRFELYAKDAAMAFHDAQEFACVDA